MNTKRINIEGQVFISSICNYMKDKKNIWKNLRRWNDGHYSVRVCPRYLPPRRAVPGCPSDSGSAIPSVQVFVSLGQPISSRRSVAEYRDSGREAHSTPPSKQRRWIRRITSIRRYRLNERGSVCRKYCFTCAVILGSIPYFSFIMLKWKSNSKSFSRNSQRPVFNVAATVTVWPWPSIQ